MADIFELFKKIEKKNDTPAAPITHLVVGLGNPGDKYLRTRHNAGFIAIDYICEKQNVRCDRLKFKALTGEITLGGKRMLLMKPQTFMNLSGEAVSAAADFYKIAPENIIVIVDDIALAPGGMRIRRGGSAGGHNGLKSIIEHLSSDAFPRIRIGVGEKPNAEYDLADWVLGTFSREDIDAMLPCLDGALDSVGLIADGKTDMAMGKYNKKKLIKQSEEK
ncbi:MAG: aminoacyl-tRNA hydrolase [Clostridia bacterium]|nr:aminoacyl-tRNA hydrolase [Clostridia bacterium]